MTGNVSMQMFILSKATMRVIFQDDLRHVAVVNAKIGTKELIAEKTKYNDQDAVDIRGILATELNQPVVFVLSDGTTVRYAATDWVKSVLSDSTDAALRALAKSLYFYNKTANEYFND